MTRNLPYDRAQRVADEVHHIIATVCYNEIRDPRLKGLEITHVMMTKDLKIARVYFYSKDVSEDGRLIMKKGLESATGFFKKAIGRDLKLRYMPEMEFFFDDSVELGQKLEKIMKKEGS
jgi:ribosome-binding factor A